MVDHNQLSWMAVALVLAGVAVLATAAAYFAQKRESDRLFLWLAAIRLLACVVAFGINPTTLPFQRV